MNALAVYELRTDSDSFPSLFPVRHDLLLLDAFDAFPPTPVPVHLLEAVVDRSGRAARAPMPDFAYMETRAIAISTRAVAVLRDVLEPNGQLIPLVTIEGEYYAYHVLTVVDALDEARSEVVRYPRGDVFVIEKHVFVADHVRDLTVFRVPQGRGRDIYVTNSFRDRVIAHGLTGLRLVEVWPQHHDDVRRQPESGAGVRSSGTPQPVAREGPPERAAKRARPTAPRAGDTRASPSGAEPGRAGAGPVRASQRRGVTATANPVHQLALDVGLGEWAEHLANAAEPSLRLRLGESPGEPFGSRLGGEPVLPPDTRWPMYRGWPHSFIGQLRLADFAGWDSATALPKHGLLSFFYDSLQEVWGFAPDDAEGWRVFWFPEFEGLQPRATPDDVVALRSHALSVEEEWTIPDASSAFFERIGLERALSARNISDAYVELDKRLAGVEGEPRHRILGHPDQIQTEMPLECELVTNGIDLGDSAAYEDPRVPALAVSAARWKLLLQVDSDDALETMWADGGRIYYWIPDDALSAAEFGRVWLILQSG